MFRFLRKARRALKQEQQLAHAPVDPLQPLGLRRGGYVTLDPLPFQMLQQSLLFVPPSGAQRIEARGRVDLGAGAELHRFYLTDDAFVQVSTTARVVEDLKLFVFDETKTPSNKASFEHWLGAESIIGRETVEHRGKRYSRVWGDEGQVKAPPVTFDEQVFTESDGAPEYEVSHFCMLYERREEGSGRMEYLLISAEETGEAHTVVFSVGVDVSEADLDIV